MKAVIKVDSDTINMLIESGFCPKDIGLKAKKCDGVEEVTPDYCRKCFKKAFKKSKIHE